MHDFHYTGKKLRCEGVTLEALARKYGTPLYVYSQHTLTESFQDLDRAMAGVDHRVCFAVKSNSNQAVLRVLARLGSGFDIVSGGELQRVIAAGGDPRQCAFAGVGKTEDEIEFALKQGVYTFNAAQQGASVLLAYAYGAAPFDLQEACGRLVAEMYRKRSWIGQSSQVQPGIGTTAYSKMEVELGTAMTIERYRMRFLP